LEGSTSEKTAAAAAETMSTNSKTKNEADTQFYAPKQKTFPLILLAFFSTLFQYRNSTILSTYISF
jgi:hypothetical protein